MKSAALSSGPFSTPSSIQASIRSSSAGSSWAGSRSGFALVGEDAARRSGIITPARALVLVEQVAAAGRCRPSGRALRRRGGSRRPGSGGRPSGACRSPTAPPPRPRPARRIGREQRRLRVLLVQEARRSRGSSRSARSPAFRPGTVPSGRRTGGRTGASRRRCASARPRRTPCIRRGHRMQHRDELHRPIGQPLVIEHEHRRAAGVRAGDHVERVHQPSRSI